MSEENPPVIDPVVDTPADPPADPPKVHDGLDSLRSSIDSLSHKVETLASQIESITPDSGPGDHTPIKRPWTARGRQ